MHTRIVPLGDGIVMVFIGINKRRKGLLCRDLFDSLGHWHKDMYPRVRPVEQVSKSPQLQADRQYKLIRPTERSRPYTVRDRPDLQTANVCGSLYLVALISSNKTRWQPFTP